MNLSDKETSSNDKTRPPMSNRFRLIFALYFCVLIIASLVSLVFIWNPIQGSLTAIKTEKRVINGPGKDKMFIIDIKNSSSSSDWRNVTSIRYGGGNNNNNTVRIENITRKPLSGQAFGTDPEIVFTNQEIRLVLFATLFGIIGASIHGLGSLTAWISTDKLQAGWGIWYLTRPPIGAALAIITYIIIRAGFISGAGGPAAISDFGVAGISALVGLMTDEMTSKLRDVFDALFGIKKPEAEKGESPVKKTKGLELNAKTNIISVNEKLDVTAKIIKKDGSPATGVLTSFAIDDNSIIGFTGAAIQKTNNEGIATVEVQGKKIGVTSVIAKATLEREIEVDDFSVKVN
jgi:hypothetical protein